MAPGITAPSVCSVHVFIHPSGLGNRIVPVIGTFGGHFGRRVGLRDAIRFAGWIRVMNLDVRFPISDIVGTADFGHCFVQRYPYLVKHEGIVPFAACQGFKIAGIAKPVLRRLDLGVWQWFSVLAAADFFAVTMFVSMQNMNTKPLGIIDRNGGFGFVLGGLALCQVGVEGENTQRDGDN